jgi:putative endonuclease
MITVYIIHSTQHNRYYVGITGNMARRLTEHRAGKTRSVPASDDWTLVWSQETEDHATARSLEKRIKGRGAERFLNGG